jgi:hypothetical protein
MTGVDHLHACDLVVGQRNQPEPELVNARRRKPGMRRLIAQAEKAGKTVTSVTTPDGHTLTFGEPQSSEANNPWLVDLDKVTKQ